MLDWLTLTIETPPELDAEVSRWNAARPHVMRYTPATGEVAWDVTVRESVRSDSHSVVLQAGSSLTVSGSPARSMGQRHNVWGTDSLALAAAAHVGVVERVTGWRVPSWREWRVTRVDVTHNYDVGSLAGVRQALAYLRQADGGRYKVRAQSETVYWSPGSRMRAGKAYAKGPHLRWQVQRGQAEAEVWEVELAQRLLRLELRLGGEWWRRVRDRLGHAGQWRVDLDAEFREYWAGLVGEMEVLEMGVLERLRQVAPSEGQALAAHRTWCVIAAVGHQAARESMPRATWYRHLRLLQAAGLRWGDIAAGQVVPLRSVRLDVDRPARCWEDLAA